jgi:thiol peroxidase
VVTLKGKAITLSGPGIEPGRMAPDFKIIDNTMKEVSLYQSKGKVRLISVVFSIETPICDNQTQYFDVLLGKYPRAVGYSISMDLPFTLERHRKEHEIKNLKLLSDHREASFGAAYGLLIKDMRLLARAVFVIDPENVVRYVEYVKEIGQSPDYPKALEVLETLVNDCSDG